MSEKYEISQTENGVVTHKKGKRKSCGRHCKRFWWIYLIVFIIIAILATTLIIFVAVPEIAQDAVNDAELEMQGVNILETTADSYLMEINSTISTSGKLHATVEAFEADLYLEDFEPQTPFAKLMVPETSGAANQDVNITQQVEITDLDAFIRFNTWFTLNDTLRLTVDGRTSVQPDGLDRNYGVDFKKVLEIKGLNLFQGTEVTGGEIDLEPDAEYNFVGTAEIPNQSIFTLDIGNVTFINFVGDEELGTLEIHDLLLVPGINTVEVLGNLDQIAILQLVRSPEFCQTGIIPFKLLGDSVENNGVPLPYFAEALGAGNQTVNIDIGSIIEASLGAPVSCADEE